MKKIIYLVILIVFASCKNNNVRQTDNTGDNLTKSEENIAHVFSEIDSLLKVDNGKFWGRPLYGSLLFINPETRLFYTNENGSDSEFEKIGKIYRDSLPAEINIANTAINWKNKRWTMVMLPLPTDRLTRNNLIIHELFHGIQPKIGFDNLKELDNAHLDTYEPRLLLRLEIEALNKAIETNNENTRLQHIHNALLFRHKRHKTRAIKDAENALELNEGLAEYTGVILSGRNTTEMQAHFDSTKKSFYKNPTFVRSFAYQTIPRYGYLLSQTQPNWHRDITNNSNLTTILLDAFNPKIPDEISVEKIATQFDYNYEISHAEETKREQARIEKMARLKAKFIDAPTLELAFENMNISFDPRNIVPLENFGTVYPTLRVTDNWGILTVENGALLASNWGKVTVSQPTNISGDMVKGDGWKLELKSNWKVEKVANEYKLLNKNAGDYN